MGGFLSSLESSGWLKHVRAVLDTSRFEFIIMSATNNIQLINYLNYYFILDLFADIVALLQMRWTKVYQWLSIVRMVGIERLKYVHWQH